MSRNGAYKVSGVLGDSSATASQKPVAPVVLEIPLMAAASVETESVEGRVVELDPNLIDDSPYQPADGELDRYDPVGIGELAQAIASEGQRDPIKVRKLGNRYELLAGHRRVRACRMLKRPVRALVERLDDAAAERAVMVDNEGRKDKTDYARAKLYRRALDSGYAKNQNDVAAMFATNPSRVSRRLKMLTLPASIRALMDANPTLLSLNDAEILLGLVELYPDHIDIITQAAARMDTPGATAQSLKPWVAQMIAAKGKGAAAKAKHAEPRVITDASKRTAYTARVKGNVITLRVHGDNVPPETVLARVAEFLERSANLEIAKAGNE